jgi:deoxyadenosine/deoxycytidine kinase
MEKITQMRETETVLKTTSVVQDTPITQDVYSYAKAQHVLGNIDDAEWHLYLKIYRSFEQYLPKPDAIVYLETSLEEITKRIEKRGRGYEKQIPASYLELLDMLNRKWLSENKDVPVVVIPTDGLNIVNNVSAQRKLVATVKKSLSL